MNYQILFSHYAIDCGSIRAPSKGHGTYKRPGAHRFDLQQLRSHDIHVDFITFEESSALRTLGHLIPEPTDEALGVGFCIRDALEETRIIILNVALREHGHQGPKVRIR